MLSGEDRNRLAERIAPGLVEALRQARLKREGDEQAVAEALAKVAIVGIESEGWRIVRAA